MAPLSNGRGSMMAMHQRTRAVPAPRIDLASVCLSTDNIHAHGGVRYALWRTPTASYVIVGWLIGGSAEVSFDTVSVRQAARDGQIRLHISQQKLHEDELHIWCNSPRSHLRASMMCRDGTVRIGVSFADEQFARTTTGRGKRASDAVSQP